MAAVQDRKKINQSIRDLDLEDVYIKRQLESGSITREEAAKKRIDLDIKREELTHSQEQIEGLPGDESHDKKHKGKHASHEEHGPHQKHETEASVTTSNSTPEESQTGNSTPSFTITSAQTFTHPADENIPPLSLGERDRKILSDLSETHLRISKYRDDQAAIQKSFEDGKITAQQATNRTQAIAQRINKLEAKANRITESRQGKVAAANKIQLEQETAQAQQAEKAKVTAESIQTSSATTASSVPAESTQAVAETTEAAKKGVLGSVKSGAKSAARTYAKVGKYTPLGYAVGKMLGPEDAAPEVPPVKEATKTAKPTIPQPQASDTPPVSRIDQAKSGAKSAAKTYAKIGKFTPLGYAVGKIIEKNTPTPTPPPQTPGRQIGRTGSINFQEGTQGFSSTVNESRGYGGQISNQVSQAETRIASNAPESTPSVNSQGQTSPEENQAAQTPSASAPASTSSPASVPLTTTQAGNNTGGSSSSSAFTFTSPTITSSGTSGSGSSTPASFTTSASGTGTVPSPTVVNSPSALHPADDTTNRNTPPPPNKPPPAPTSGTLGKVKTGAQKATSGYARVFKYTPLGYVAGRISSRSSERDTAKRTVVALEKEAIAAVAKRAQTQTPAKSAKPNYFKTSAGTAAKGYGKFLSKSPLGFLVRRITPQGVKDYIHDVRLARIEKRDAKIIEKNIAQNTHAAKPTPKQPVKTASTTKRIIKSPVSAAKVYFKPHMWLARKLRLIPQKNTPSSNLFDATKRRIPLVPTTLRNTPQKMASSFARILPFKGNKTATPAATQTQIKVKVPTERKTARQYQHMWNKKVLENARLLRKYNRTWLVEKVKSDARDVQVWARKVWNNQPPNRPGGLVTAGGYFPNSVPARPQYDPKQQNRHSTTMHMPNQRMGNFSRTSYGESIMPEWTSPRGLVRKTWGRFGSPRFSSLNNRFGGRFAGRAASNTAKSIARNAASNAGKKLTQQLGKQAIQGGAKLLIANPVSLIVIGVVIAIVALIIIFVVLISDSDSAKALGGDAGGGGGGVPVPSANPIPGFTLSLTGSSEINVSDNADYTVTVTYDESKSGPVDGITIFQDVPTGADYVETSGTANYNSSTRQVSWSLASTDNRSSFTFRLKPNKDNVLLKVSVYATMAAGSGGTPNQDTCGGFYAFTYTADGQTFTNPKGNFADTDCTYAKNVPAAKDELSALLAAQDPDNANWWFLTVIPCESSYNPNAYRDHLQGPDHTPDPNGAWGLFQIGSAPGSNDNGAVGWRQQVTNATSLLKERGRGYWACQ